MVSSKPARVLIVDESSENREVLRTILQRHGFETLEASHADRGLSLAKAWHPKVIVIDCDTVDFGDHSVCNKFDDQARDENTSVVLLGRIHSSNLPLSTSEVLPKPYHYAPLVRKIEELLQADSATTR